MGVLIKDYTVEDFRGYGKVTVPKGTKTTHRTACGIDEKYNFVDEFGWIEPYEDGLKKYGLIMDMKSYGLNVPKEFVTED